MGAPRTLPSSDERRLTREPSHVHQSSFPRVSESRSNVKSNQMANLKRDQRTLETSCLYCANEALEDTDVTLLRSSGDSNGYTCSGGLPVLGVWTSTITSIPSAQPPSPGVSSEINWFSDAILAENLQAL